MNASIELQKQIKDNAEDVRRFVSELSSWEAEMKRKESAARAAASKESSDPPVRNSPGKRDSNNSKATNPLGDARDAKKRISSNDYAAWEKFDVEKACEEVDDPSHKSNSESEEEKNIRENRLRDEANMEKEKGNTFVKKEKWDNAIECYSKAIKCFSRDAIFYCNRALCYLKKKDYRAAETDCTSALALDNSYVKALHRRGLARKELNQFEEALDDLKRASDLEPNNTAVARDFNTVRLKVTQIGINTILEAQRAETEIIMDLGIDKNPDPILPAKKHRTPTTTSKEAPTKQKSSSSVVWPTVENSAVIEPVILPPHKRSKKPLVRIQVQDSAAVGTASSSREADPPVPSSTTSSDKMNLQEALEKLSELNAKCDAKSSARPNKESSASATLKSPVVPTSSEPKTVPPVPKNSVQFLAAWRQINKNSAMCFQYLKKINGASFPKIFQDSLDGNILSQILSVLATEFVAANQPVLAYLQGLTQVRRFRTLTLFLSQADKSNMDSLFKHTQNLEKTSADVLENLKKEYEL